MTTRFFREHKKFHHLTPVFRQHSQSKHFNCNKIAVRTTNWVRYGKHSTSDMSIGVFHLFCFFVSVLHMNDRKGMLCFLYQTESEVKNTTDAFLDDFRHSVTNSPNDTNNISTSWKYSSLTSWKNCVTAFNKFSNIWKFPASLPLGSWRTL